MSRQRWCSPSGPALGAALSPQLRTPQVAPAARPSPSAAPMEFKPCSQAGWVAARLLGSPNPSLRGKFNTLLAPPTNKQGPSRALLLSYRETALDALLHAALQHNTVRGFCSLARPGQANTLPQILALSKCCLSVPTNLQEMCQEYSLAP